MTAVEFRATRLALGLTQVALARFLGVAVRSIRHWESGHHHVPGPVALAVRALAQPPTGA